MFRSELAALEAKKQAELEEEVARVRTFLGKRRDEVLTANDILEALYPGITIWGWKIREPISDRVVSAIFWLIKSGEVEKVEMSGSSEQYYGITQ